MMRSFSAYKFRRFHFSSLRIVRSYTDDATKSIGNKYISAKIARNGEASEGQTSSHSSKDNTNLVFKSNVNHVAKEFNNREGIINKNLCSNDLGQIKSHEDTTSSEVFKPLKLFKSKHYCEKPLVCVVSKGENVEIDENVDSSLSVNMNKTFVDVLGATESTFNSSHRKDLSYDQNDPQIVSLAENIQMDFCNPIVLMSGDQGGNSSKSDGGIQGIGVSDTSGIGKDPCQKEPTKQGLMASKGGKDDGCKKDKDDPCKGKIETKDQKKDDPCKKKDEKKDDPCKKKDEKKDDPCKKKDEKKDDPCKKKDEKKEQKKVDLCKKKDEKKEDPCKKKDEKKEDPCKKKDEKKEDPCKKKQEKKEDPCKKKEEKKDPCKKDEKKDPCKKKEEKKDPCKKDEKKDPCKKKDDKKEDPCKKKDEKKDDPCKKKDEKKEQKKEDPSKKTDGKKQDGKKAADPCKMLEKRSDPCKKKEDTGKAEKKPDPCKMLEKKTEPCKKEEKKIEKKPEPKVRKTVCRPPSKCHRRRQRSEALFWRNVSLFGALPFLLLLTGLVFSSREEIERPEFVKYPYLRLRNKRFPWGEDGMKSLFHNPRVNPLPDGYEDELEKEEGEDTEEIPKEGEIAAETEKALAEEKEAQEKEAKAVKEKEQEAAAAANEGAAKDKKE